MNEERVLRFIQLTKRKRELEENLKEVNATLALAEPSVSNFLTAKGANSHSTSEGTIFFRKHVYASLKPDDDGTFSAAFEALRSHDLGHLITQTVTPQDLKAWAKALDSTKQELPDALSDHVAISKTYKVTVRT